MFLKVPVLQHITVARKRALMVPRHARNTHSHQLKHRVGIGGLLGNFLSHVPVLDHLAVFQPEDVDDGVAAAAGCRHVVDVQDHIVAVGKHPLDLAVVVRKFLMQKGEERFEPLGSVRGARIVLDIAGA